MGKYLKPPDLEIHFVTIGLLWQAFPIGYIIYSRKTNQMDSVRLLKQVPDLCGPKTELLQCLLSGPPLIHWLLIQGVV